MTAGKRLKGKEAGKGSVSGKGTLVISCRVASVFLFEVEGKAICRQWGNVVVRGCEECGLGGLAQTA